MTNLEHYGFYRLEFKSHKMILPGSDYVISIDVYYKPKHAKKFLLKTLKLNGGMSEKEAKVRWLLSKYKVMGDEYLYV